KVHPKTVLLLPAIWFETFLTRKTQHSIKTRPVRSTPIGSLSMNYSNMPTWHGAMAKVRRLLPTSTLPRCALARGMLVGELPLSVLHASLRIKQLSYGH